MKRDEYGWKEETRLNLILPRVEPEEIHPPSVCPYEGRGRIHFQFLQELVKPLRDTYYPWN